jgi:hypothetical protein
MNKIWEFRELDGQRYGRRMNYKQDSEAYECGYEDGYEDAMKEFDYGERSRMSRRMGSRL